MKLSRDPQCCGPHDWYYEERTHVELVHQVHDKLGALVKTDNIKIPWSKLIASVARYRKPSPPPGTGGAK